MTTGFSDDRGQDVRLRILLVDDHPILRAGIRQVLESHGSGVFVGEAGDGAVALQLLGTATWDVMLLDLTLPGTLGIDVLKTVKRGYPTLPVLVFSVHPPHMFAQRLLASGASGYLSKSADPAELWTAIEQVRHGRLYVGDTGAASLSSDPRRVAPSHDSLSNREFQVLRQLGTGKTVSEIATRLGLSVKTVSTYRGRVLEKLGLHSSGELMRYAIENDLIDD